VENINSAVETLVSSSNTFFILLGAIMVFFMHAGFAFLEVGMVRTSLPMQMNCHKPMVMNWLSSFSY
jgi:ammonia channel protein AmtB